MNALKLTGKIALVLFILFLAGTIPSLEPNRRLVAEAAGIDYRDGQFIMSAYGITDFGDSGMEGRKCVAVGKTIAEAADNFVYTEGKDLFLKQCKLVAVGPGAAERMKEVLDYFIATRDLNYFARVVLTGRPAEQLFDTKELLVNDLFYLTEKQKRDEEVYQNRMVALLKQGLRDEENYLLPMLDASGTEVASVTAFSGHRIVSELTREEYRLVELLSGLRSEANLTIDTEMVHISGATNQLSVFYKQGNLAGEQTLSLAVQGSDEKKEQLVALLKSAADKLSSRAQCDVFGMYLTFKMTNHEAYLEQKQAGRIPQFSLTLSVEFVDRKDGALE